jgi:hypothetical protein
LLPRSPCAQPALISRSYLVHMPTLDDRRPAMSQVSRTTEPVRSPGFGQRTLPTLELAGIAGLGAVVAIHATELAGKVDEVQYLGAGYVALIAAALVAIVMLAVGDRRRWVLAGLTAGTTLTGYVLTRTVGLPGSSGDIGNWSEPLAVWAMFSEIAVVVLAVAGTLGHPNRETAGDVQQR